MLELSVCIGSSCHLKGSYNIIQVFQQMIEKNALHNRIELKATFCLKECHNPGVAVSLNGERHHIVPEDAWEFFMESVLPLVS